MITVGFYQCYRRGSAKNGTIHCTIAIAKCTIIFEICFMLCSESQISKCPRQQRLMAKLISNINNVIDLFTATHSNLLQTTFFKYSLIKTYVMFVLFQFLLVLFRISIMTSSNGTFSALLAICAGNSPLPKKPVERSFYIFFDLRLNKRLNKQPWGWWFETLSRPLWRHRNEHFGCCDIVRCTFLSSASLELSLAESYPHPAR